MSEILKLPKIVDLPFHITKIALVPSDRKLLHQQIARRFQEMIKQGLIDEVKIIRKKFQLTAESPSMRCVGYRQVWLYLDNEINLTELQAMGIAATRQLAKRQLTWLRSMRNNKLKEFDCLATDVPEQVQAFLQESGLE